MDPNQFSGLSINFSMYFYTQFLDSKYWYAFECECEFEVLITFCRWYGIYILLYIYICLDYRVCYFCFWNLKRRKLSFFDIYIYEQCIQVFFCTINSWQQSFNFQSNLTFALYNIGIQLEQISNTVQTEMRWHWGLTL